MHAERYSSNGNQGLAVPAGEEPTMSSLIEATASLNKRLHVIDHELDNLLSRLFGAPQHDPAGHSAEKAVGAISGLWGEIHELEATIARIEQHVARLSPLA